MNHEIEEHLGHYCATCGGSCRKILQFPTNKPSPINWPNVREAVSEFGSWVFAIGAAAFIWTGIAVAWIDLLKFFGVDKWNAVFAAVLK